MDTGANTHGSGLRGRVPLTSALLLLIGGDFACTKKEREISAQPGDLCMQEANPVQRRPPFADSMRPPAAVALIGQFLAQISLPDVRTNILSSDVVERKFDPKNPARSTETNQAFSDVCL